LAALHDEHAYIAILLILLLFYYHFMPRIDAYRHYFAKYETLKLIGIARKRRSYPFVKLSFRPLRQSRLWQGRRVRPHSRHKIWMAGKNSKMWKIEAFGPFSALAARLTDPDDKAGMTPLMASVIVLTDDVRICRDQAAPITVPRRGNHPWMRITGYRRINA
jgi:hypothetical protein